MRPSNDEIHELHERLDKARADAFEKRGTIARADVLDRVERQFLQDIMIVYFLCDAGLIKIDGNVVTGGELFSDDCLNDGNLITNFLALVNQIEGNDLGRVTCNGHDVRCNPLNVPLFNVWPDEEIALRDFAIDQNGGHFIFDILNAFHWCIDEFFPGDGSDAKVITPAILADFFAIEEPGHSRKKKGIYYTPRDIACYICKDVLNAYLFGKQEEDAIDSVDAITGNDAEVLQETLAKIDALKALDPACGTGEFLLVLANELLLVKERLLAVNEPGAIVQDDALRSEILIQNIHGTDLMGAAVKIARQRSWLWSLASYKHSPIASDTRIALPDLSRNIRPGNALIGWLDECMNGANDLQAVNEKFSAFYREHGIAAFADPAMLPRLNPVHWHVDHPQGFDIIVGNPPYIFNRGKSFSDLETACYKTWYLTGYSTLVRGKARQAGKINAFGLFLVRSLKLLKENGKLGFIMPNTILRTTTNDTLRQFLLDAASIKEIVDLQDGVFSGVTASTIILLLERKSAAGGSTLMQVKHVVVDLLGGKYQRHEIDQARFIENTACCFDIHVTGEFSAMFRAMKDDSFELGEIASEIIEGLVTRRGDALFTADATNPLSRKMLRGKDIDRYSIHWRNGQYIIYDPELLHRARPLRVHEAPVKLIAQRIGGGTFPLRVAYDDKQFYVFASINAILLKDEPVIDGVAYNYKYVLACLNSMLLNAYYLLTFSNKSTLTVNVSKTFLELLPIKQASMPDQETIAQIVDYTLFLKEFHYDRDDLIDFFDKVILDSLIFEHYLLPENPKPLIDVVRRHLKEIDLASKDDEAILTIIDEVAACLMGDENHKKSIRFIRNLPEWLLVQDLFKGRVGKEGN